MPLYVTNSTMTPFQFRSTVVPSIVLWSYISVLSRSRGTCIWALIVFRHATPRVCHQDTTASVFTIMVYTCGYGSDLGDSPQCTVLTAAPKRHNVGHLATMYVHSAVIMGLLEGHRTCVCVTNRIPAAEGHENDLEDMLSSRVYLVRDAPGFLRNEVHRPAQVRQATGESVAGQGACFEVKTWWASMEAFENWTQSPSFAEAHSDMPPSEMLAGLASVVVTEVFISTDLRPENAVPRIMSLQQLAEFRGTPTSTNKNGRVCVGVEGKVYDVTEASMFYGAGGVYHVFAGRDATRALAKDLLEEEDVLDRPGDVSDLTGLEEAKLDQWVTRFESKYPCIAVLDTHKTAGPAAAGGTRAAPKKQPRVVKRKVRLPPGHPKRKEIDEARRAKL